MTIAGAGEEGIRSKCGFHVHGFPNRLFVQPIELAKYAVGYPAGAQAYFAYIEGWLNSGAFEGVEFR